MIFLFSVMHQFCKVLWLPPIQPKLQRTDVQLQPPPDIANALHNFSKPFVLEADASGNIIGAILMHEGQSTIYFDMLRQDQHLWHHFVV
jgi:hypothetical protein